MFLTIIEPRIGRPGFEFAWEWPRHCDGWNPTLNPPIKRLLKLLPETARVDRCMYGLCDMAGMLMRKPWRIISTSKALVKGLQCTCSIYHEHAQSWGKALRDSELYTALPCRNIIKYFLDGTVPTALVAEVLMA